MLLIIGVIKSLSLESILRKRKSKVEVVLECGSLVGDDACFLHRRPGQYVGTLILNYEC